MPPKMLFPRKSRSIADINATTNDSRSKKVDFALSSHVPKKSVDDTQGKGQMVSQRSVSKRSHVRKKSPMIDSVNKMKESGSDQIIAASSDSRMLTRDSSLLNSVITRTIDVNLGKGVKSGQRSTNSFVPSCSKDNLMANSLNLLKDLSIEQGMAYSNMFSPPVTNPRRLQISEEEEEQLLEDLYSDEEKFEVASIFHALKLVKVV